MSYQDYSKLDPIWDCEGNLMPTDENIQEYKSFSWWTSGALALIIASYGIIANSIAVTLLFRRSNVTPNLIKQMLTFQIIFDSSYLLCNIPDAIGVLDPSEAHTKLRATLFYQLKNISLGCSIGTKLVLIHERYSSTLLLGLPQPYSKNSWIYTIIRVTLVVVCSIIISIPLFYEVKEASFENILEIGINETYYGEVEISDPKLNKSDYFYDEYASESIDAILDAKSNTSHEPTHFNILLPTELRFSYHYMIWYKLVILTCIPVGLLTFYTMKTYNAVDRKLKNDGIKRHTEIKSLTDELNVHRNGCQSVEDTAGIIVMVIIFTICYGTKIIVLVYETANIKWIQEHFMSCMVPPMLFYGKSIYDLLISVNASISIYLYFCVKTNYHRINIW